MPQILIVTDSPEETPRTVVYRERIAPSDFESTHFTGQLAERVSLGSGLHVSHRTWAGACVCGCACRGGS